MVAIGLKPAPEQNGLVLGSQLFRRTECQSEPRLVEVATGVLTELCGERGYDVDRGVDAWKFFKHAHHPPIVLDRVQAGPGQHVRPGGRVAILRLMHMPEQDEVESAHAAAILRCGRRGVLEWRLLAMRIIDRYIYREVLLHALFGLAVFTFVFFVPQLVQMMDLVVRHSGSPREIFELFLCTIPGVLTFTLPIAVLIGVQIGIGRMSGDSELIAMNALGMGVRRLLLPVVALAITAVGLTLSMTLWLNPLSVHTLRGLEDRMRATQASFQVQPRVFNEQFPHLVLYVQDVSAAATHWHGVFLAESDAQDVSRLTLAEDAIVIAERAEGKLALYLRNGGVHEVSAQDQKHYGLSAFSERDFSLSVVGDTAGGTPPITDEERSLSALAAERGPDARRARVETQRRLAFPAACLVFALVALPLAARPRRGGRAAGLLIALVLLIGYYLISALGAGLARSGNLPVWLGIWSANITIAAAGLALLPRVERMPGDDRIGQAFRAATNWVHQLSWRTERRAVDTAPRGPFRSDRLATERRTSTAARIESPSQTALPGRNCASARAPDFPSFLICTCCGILRSISCYSWWASLCCLKCSRFLSCSTTLRATAPA